jgi:hypothetical protein
MSQPPDQSRRSDSAGHRDASTKAADEDRPHLVRQARDVGRDLVERFGSVPSIPFVDDDPARHGTVGTAPTVSGT